MVKQLAAHRDQNEKPGPPKRKTKPEATAPKATVVDAMSDLGLFGRFYEGDSWSGWKSILRAAFNLPMDDADRDFLKIVADREPPTKPVRELWIAAGRRCGKDSIASLIAAHAAMTFDLQGRLRPGERATILCLAPDKETASICFKYVRELFASVPMLDTMVLRTTADTLELNNQVDITVVAANFKSIRGRALSLVVLDECAFFTADNSANPDKELYRAILPGLSTLDGKIVAISSPYRRSGILYEKFKAHHGQPSDEVLFVKGATRTLNPGFDQAIVDQALAEDAAAASAEFLGEFRSDIAGWLSPEVIEIAIDRGVVVRQPNTTMFDYVGYIDSASGSGQDSFTCAISHLEHDTAVLDFVLEVRPPFSAAEAVAQVAKALKMYGLTTAQGDKYAGGIITDLLASNGVQYTHSSRDTSTVFSDAASLFSSGRVKILDLPRLHSQLNALERRTAPGGRDRIGHPRGGHDDIAASVCGALTLATSKPKSGGFLFASVGNPSNPRSNSNPTPIYRDDFDRYGTIARRGSGLLF